MALWKDYSHNTGRSKPVGVVHCQAHHDRPGYSVKLAPSEAKRSHCLTCGPNPDNPPISTF